MSASGHRCKQRDHYSLKHLSPHFSGVEVSKLKRADVRRYVSARLSDGVKESTVKRELKLFSAALNFVRLEYDRPELGNPVQSLGLGGDDSRIRWITREQASVLVAEAGRFALRPHLSNFVRLGLNTGCRKSELLKLEWSRVDFERECFMLDRVHTKNGKRRLVPLNAAAMSALLEQRDWVSRYVPGARWVFAVRFDVPVGTLQKGFAAACLRAGIEDFRIHDLRHTFASWLVMRGVSLYVVRDLLGHSSIAVTERYAHLSPDQGRGAVQGILPF